MLSSYDIVGEHVMQICDLTMEITDTKDTLTSTDSELILHGMPTLCSSQEHGNF